MNNVTITLTATAGTVTATVSNGEQFTVKDRDGFIRSLDRKLEAAGIARRGYRVNTDGGLTAEATIIR